MSAAREIIKRIHREPYPQPGTSTYSTGELERRRLRHRQRKNAATAALSSGPNGRWTRIRRDVEGWRADQIEKGTFTETELDEIVAAAEAQYEASVLARKRRDAADLLAAEIKVVSKQLEKQEAAERRAKVEQLARKRLGWPKSGLPDLEEVE